jgi:Orsellinic acid/F9775 biosynthesis cluster protein D
MSSLYTSFIQYNHQHQVAICSDCQTGYTKKNLKRHLFERPHFLKKDQWKPILDTLKDKPLLESNAHFPRPSNGSQPVPYLKIRDGFECNICGWVITSQRTMRAKHAKLHREDLRWGQCFYHPVKVQVSTPHLAPFLFD